MPLTLDAAAPLISHPRDLRRHRAALREGGVDAVLATLGSIEDFDEMVSRLAGWAAFANAPTHDAVLARSVADVERAHQDGRLAIVLHMQGSSAIATSIERIDLFHALGVRVMQLTYNYRNQLGDGCLESHDGGLSDLGRRAVQRFNQLGITLDISHTGPRTSMEAIELAGGPVVATHANARAVHDTPRNLSDELIRAVAATGGVIGMCAFSAFVAPQDASLEKLLDHGAHVADLVGPAHVGLGLDYAQEDEDSYEYFGYDPRYYPRPPWSWPTGITGFRDEGNIPAALERRGFSAEDIAGIMGGNFLRAFRARWGG